MTDCTLTVYAAPTPIGKARSRRRLPAGIPRWLWLLGVVIVPVSVTRREEEDLQAWVVSAGAGITHVAALLHDEPPSSPDPIRREEHP